MAKTSTINWPLFREMLKSTRARRGHSFRRVARQTGISVSTIIRIETHALPVAPDNFLLLCDYMSTRPEHFQSGQSVPVKAGHSGIQGALQAIMDDKSLSSEARTGLVQFLCQAYDLCAGLPKSRPRVENV